MNNYHESVLVKEIVEGLHVNKASKYIDATLGTGGHSLAIVKAGGLVLGIEADPAILAISKKRLEKEIANKKVKLVRGNFVNIDAIARENDFENVRGILFDLGVTNLHLTGSDRGFSFASANLSSGLDMRLDPESEGVKASDLLTVLREDQLRKLFEVTLNPGAAMWLSKRIVKYRVNSAILTVGDMMTVCKGLKTEKVGLNPATLPFLALRIAVNSELLNLESALPKAFELLKEVGRLLVISFHSKEDAIVKSYFKSLIDSNVASPITYKPLVPSESEIFENRKSRSAKLRIIQKND